MTKVVSYAQAIFLVCLKDVLFLQCTTEVHISQVLLYVSDALEYRQEVCCREE